MDLEMAFAYVLTLFRTARASFSKFRTGVIVVISLIASTLLILQLGGYRYAPLSTLKPQHQTALAAHANIMAGAKEYIDRTRPTSAFGEMGYRTQKLAEWFEASTQIGPDLSDKESRELMATIEKAVASTFPFLRKSGGPDQFVSFLKLWKMAKPGSRGIVIPTGKRHLRYTFHLIANIRSVLKSELPIQVAYAGDDDLPSSERNLLTSYFKDVETVDMLEIFDNSAADLRNGGWAIKPFALLASKFEKTLLVDADSVFLQKPEVLFDAHPGFIERGALLFHDRLLWKNIFIDRAKWWKEEMGDRVISDTLRNSKVWMEGYAEEVDSGVVAMDKSRIPVFMALFHICWQNSSPVREEITYRMTYGDKESWWFGLELCGVPFVFEDHYASILGQTEDRQGQKLVCSFTIAHLDAKRKLLWYNGSLLRNKLVNHADFLVPDVWATDGEWLKGATKLDLSCMAGAEIRTLEHQERSVILESITAAKEADNFALSKGIDLITTSS
jgi:alpha 1,3-mannosyltransferase